MISFSFVIPKGRAHSRRTNQKKRRLIRIQTPKCRAIGRRSVQLPGRCQSSQLPQSVCRMSCYCMCRVLSGNWSLTDSKLKICYCKKLKILWVGSKSTSTSSSIDHSSNNPTTYYNNCGEENSKSYEEDKIFEKNDKEVQNKLLEVVTKYSKNMFHVRNVIFIFYFLNSSLYCDVHFDQEFVRG